VGTNSLRVFFFNQGALGEKSLLFSDLILLQKDLGCPVKPFDWSHKGLLCFRLKLNGLANLTLRNTAPYFEKILESLFEALQLFLKGGNFLFQLSGL